MSADRSDVFAVDDAGGLTRPKDQTAAVEAEEDARVRAIAERNGTVAPVTTRIGTPEELERLRAAKPDFPHTAGVVRRQVTDPDDPDPAGTKRRHEGAPAGGPVLGSPTEAEAARATRDPTDADGFYDPAAAPPAAEPEADPDAHLDGPDLRDPTRSPILAYLTEHGPASAPAIARHLGRKSGNVATRLRQLEVERVVRRTGRTITGGRGGPQIEWTLAGVDDRPTSPDDVLESPTTPGDRAGLRHRYHLLLLSRLTDAQGDDFDRIADRIERLLGD